LTELRVGMQDTGRLASLEDAGNRIVDGGLNVRVSWIANMPHCSAQVGRPDKNSVYTFHCGDRFQAVERFRSFYLHHNANFFIGAMQIVGYTVPARSARSGTADATHARGWIARGGDG